MTDNPLILEYERQCMPMFRHRANAQTRLLAALHESAHVAGQALHYPPHNRSAPRWGEVSIPFDRPLDATVSNCPRSDTSDVMFALSGAVASLLLLGNIRYAQHDYDASVLVFDWTYGKANGPTMLQQMLREQAALLSSDAAWPRIEAFACEVMKYERLRGNRFVHAFNVAGLGGRKASHKQPNYLNRFSRTPAELVGRLGDDLVENWRSVLGKTST